MSVVLPIETNDRFEKYTASAGQTVFPVPFPFQDNADVAALLQDPVTGDYSELSSTLYTLTGAGNPSGGSLAFAAGRTEGDVILMLGRAVLERLSSVVRDGAFSSKLIDGELDRNRIIQQEQARDIARALKTDYGAAPQTLPPPSPGNYLGWSADGKLVSKPSEATSAAAAEASAAAAAASAASISMPAAPAAGDFLRRNAGNTAYEALTASELVTAINVKALNADSGFSFETLATTQNYMPAGTFGGAWKAGHVFASSDAAAFAGQRSTIAITRTVVGAGGNNPVGDYSLWVVSKNEALDGTDAGEVGSIRFANFGNKVGDKAGIIGSSYKHRGDGTIQEGANLAFEFSAVQFQNNNISDQTFNLHILGAYITNPAHQILAAQKSIGYYSANHKGPLFAHLMGVDDNSNVGDGTAEYALYFHRSLTTTSKYFSVAASTGHIESVDNTAGAAGGSWRRTRNKGAGTNGDVLWHDYYAGRNAANAAMDYVRLSGIIDTATAGAERGTFIINTAINGVLTAQVTARNGVSLGAATGGPLGTGTLNVAAAILSNGNTVVDGSRGVQFRAYTATDIANAAHAVNTTDKVAGKSIWDNTNNRILSASGSATTSSWIVANGTVAITPV